MTDTGTDWLQRSDVDRVAENISADDLIESMDSTGSEQQRGLKMVKGAFNRSAERLGYGELATARIRAADFKYLADRMEGVINVDSPLSEDTESLLGSAAIGA